MLPFNAYGTLAMARSEFEANDGSSQFFFLLKVCPPLLLLLARPRAHLPDTLPSCCT